ncbi:protein Lilipod isoform X2 [Macrosteles quadrilineatus]|nr:protein Lilipod isoform X2 [Macrosteles quadrilineatus]
MLLPFSIASNEVLLHYPTSYYVKWLNHSLVQGLWNLVFLFSNVSLFILLPFAYLFTESEGFTGNRRGVVSRLYETCAVLSLLMAIVLGLTYVVASLIDKDNADIQTFFNLGSYYLPFLYSCISFFGVLMLLLCTPLGLARLFSVVSNLLVKPQFLRDLHEEFYIASLEENVYKTRLETAKKTGNYLSPVPMNSKSPEKVLRLINGALLVGLTEKVEELTHQRKKLDMQRHTWVLQRNVVYPVCMLCLLCLTAITVLMVWQNAVELLIGIKALPISTRQFTLGLTSLSKLGPVGAVLEVVLILYLAATSVVGLYSLPLLRRLTPCQNNTPFYHLLANCILLLVLSSALPLLARTLGITNFDLMGEYGQIEWLGNFKIVLLYNIVFAAASTLCLSNQCTLAVRRELYNRFHSLVSFGNVDRNRAQAYTPKQD